MNTDKLESTRSVSLNKKGTSAHDLNELSDQELQLVTGGAFNFWPSPDPDHGYPGWLKHS